MENDLVPVCDQEGLMKRFMKYFGGLIIVLIVVFFLGPRPDTMDTPSFDKNSIGQDIDEYLAKNEASVPNLVPGAEKEIIWNNPSTREKTELAIVYVHGFSATKYETRPVSDNVAKALGANLYYTRITGHGRDGAGLAEASVVDWANDFAEAMAIGERIGEKIIIIATSNGGTISTWGLSKPELVEKVVGIAYMSPNFELQGLSTSLANIPWAETILPILGGEERSWEPRNEEHGKWWTTSYPSRAIFPMTSMLKLIKQMDKSEINTPALFIYSPDDKVVVPGEIENFASQWGAETVMEKIASSDDPYHHVIAGDIMSPSNTDHVVQKIVEWVQSING